MKCEYRREQKRAVWEFQRKEFKNIGNLQDVDNEKFWRLLHNKARGKNKKKEKMSLKIDGEFTNYGYTAIGKSLGKLF